MIGAVEFMKKWKATCTDQPGSCDPCHLKEYCRGAMAVLKEDDILGLLALVMGGGCKSEKTFHKKNDS